MQNNKGMFGRRIGRLGFLLSFIIWVLLPLVVVFIEAFNRNINITGIRGVVNIACLILLGAILIWSIPLFVSLYVRRLHDLNMSGLYALLILVPIVNLILLLYLLFAPGKDKKNMYGKPVDSLNIMVMLGFKKP